MAEADQAGLISRRPYESFAAASELGPVICNVMPSGKCLMEDLHLPAACGPDGAYKLRVNEVRLPSLIKRPVCVQSRR